MPEGGHTKSPKLAAAMDYPDRNKYNNTKERIGMHHVLVLLPSVSTAGAQLLPNR